MMSHQLYCGRLACKTEAGDGRITNLTTVPGSRSSKNCADRARNRGGAEAEGAERCESDAAIDRPAIAPGLAGPMLLRALGCALR